jgi:murein DD-endopeptidase MepM/ murein hydrolase activator NlpD
VSRVQRRHALPLVALIAAFGAGVFVDGWLRTYGPPRPVQATAPVPDTPAAPVIAAAPPPAATPAATLPADSSISAAAPPVNNSLTTAAPALPPSDRSPGRLRVPIDGMDIDALKGGFSEVRGGTRGHEAVDILRPRGTPIHAVTDGAIAKLFFSKAGGITVYQFDTDEKFCYYYAHLERYVDGLHEGQHVAQGEVLGYVGTSGNAPANTPHLHFAVFELNDGKKWWQGRPLDPYIVFKERAE